MVKIALLASFASFGWIFWRGKGSSPHPAWPEAMPTFAEGRADCVRETSGGVSFICTASQLTPAEALEAVRSAYEKAGWTTSPISAPDFRFFTKGTAIAAVQAIPAPSGSRITAIQRQNGLAQR